MAGDLTRQSVRLYRGGCLYTLSILPRAGSSTEAYGVAPFVQSEVEHIRKHGLYTPRDFDVSPFFAIIKPMLDNGFDYHQLIWNPPDIPPDTPAPKEN